MARPGLPTPRWGARVAARAGAGQARLTRRIAFGALVVALAATGTGCVSLPQEKTGKAPVWSPASADATSTFLRTYDEVTRRAAAGRNDKLITSVESGPLLQASQAEFQIAKRLDPDNKKPASAPTHTGSKVYLPKFQKYPVWFFTVSSTGEAARPTVGLVLRPRAGALWKKAVSVDLDEGVDLPPLATRDGAAVDVSQETGGTLVRPPSKVAIAYAALLADGPTAPQARAFEPHTQTTRSQQATAQNKSQSSAFSYNQKFEVTSVRALATTDGGGLELFTLAETENLAMKTGSLKFERTDAVAAYTGVAAPTAFLRTNWVWQVAAFVPPKDQGNGKVRLLGVDRSLASAEMK
ncbi:hypothetical protein [Actinopolymorpha pittospori]|uniref:DUF8094 domain-containing protein n=1 Tax=Actinopolymorpha pittospori TaxID=648752 RepID=A0A927RNW7_9ACTN|nr:hypothetical protein [Actinopolymorpha pittospori]MBE1611536.1 hypothetical protein [Actinopolymorpha pittospori]